MFALLKMVRRTMLVRSSAMLVISSQAMQSDGVDISAACLLQDAQSAAGDRKGSKICRSSLRLDSVDSARCQHRSQWYMLGPAMHRLHA
jgi:hypothetical protein